MIPKQLLVFLVLVGLLVTGVLTWMFVASDSDVHGEAIRLKPAASAEPDVKDASALTELASAEVATADEPAQDMVEGARSRTAAASESTDDNLQWLEGWVRFPDGMPNGERVCVLAVDRPRKLRGLAVSPGLVDMAWDPELRQSRRLVATADAEPDGRFRIGLPTDARVAHLAVTGRYLYSMATTQVNLPARDGPTLTAELGGWVTGTLLPPPDPSPLQSDFEWIHVELGPDVSAGFESTQIQSLGVTRETEASAAGHFEFRGIPAAGSHGISVEHKHLAALLHLGVDPEPGEHRHLELQMVRGATLRGRVVDEGGAPVPGAEVEARYRGSLGDAIGALRKTTTDAAGTFELPYVATGKIDVVATSPNMRPGRVKLADELYDGMELDGLTLIVARGARIEGWVQLPDGTPANGAEVRAGPDLNQLGGMNAMKVLSSGEGQATTDANGHFEISGLAVGTFKITAWVVIEEGEHAGRWKGSADSIAADGEALTIVLAGLVSVGGRVVDHAGEPIEAFTARAMLPASGAMFGIGADRRSRSFEGKEDGRFTLEGLDQGEWEIAVDADGYATSEVRELSLPRPEHEPELVFELQPEASVTGLVVDTAELPVPGARVTLELSIGARVAAREGAGVPQVYTDADGRFVMGSLDAGAISLRASLDGFASSEPVPCQVAYGQLSEGIVLRLRTGGTLSGVVYDDAGKPAVGRMVILQQAPSYTSQHLLNTGAEGAFRAEHLEPGTWQVIATANFISGEASLTEEGADMGEFLGSMKMAAADIIDGEETFVELGAPPADPVAIRGRVTHSGQPVEGAMVSFVPEGVAGMGAMGSMKMKVTDRAGEFELTVDEPGDFLLTVQTGLGVGLQNSVEFVEHVPSDVESHAIEIELPGGRVSGRVFGSDGMPLAECRVTLHVEGGVAFGSLMGGNYVETTTDADGRYDAHYLRAGTYTVAAGGVALGGMLGGTSQGGRSVRNGVQLSSGNWLDTIDFHLETPGELTGTVRDPAGTPVAGAGVFVRDEDGRLLERISLITTDAGGRFTYTGLAPGRYLVSARLGDRVSPESAPVLVTPQGKGEVDLTLLKGTVLRIRVVDKSGAEVIARVSVRDTQGREWAGMLAMSDLMGDGGAPFSSKEQRVGPLPQGKYTVTAVHEDGRTKSRPVTLKGQSERKVTLRLK